MIESFLEIILQVIPTKKIDHFLGDAKFGTLSRIKLSQKKGIPYIVRLKEQWNCPFQSEEGLFIHEWFRGLPVAKSLTLCLQLGEKTEMSTPLSAKRPKDGNQIIIAYNPETRNPLRCHRSK
jgi:hypothetical protein